MQTEAEGEIKMRSPARLRRLGITAKLVIPFVSIFLLTFVLLGGLFTSNHKAALYGALRSKAEILSRDLSASIAEPLSKKDSAVIQGALETIKKSDPDVTYATVSAVDGTRVASTDSHDASQSRPVQDKGASDAGEFALRDTVDSQVFEAVIPITFHDRRLGVLRVGISSAQVDLRATRAAWTLLLLGALALAAGVGVYTYIASRVVRPLLAASRRLGELAKGDVDTGRRLDVIADDEAGQLATAVNTVLDNLHRLVKELRQTSAHMGLASQHLSSATSNLSSGAQAQTTSVEETSASLEQMSASISQNADNSQQMEKMALLGSTDAEASGRAVRETVEAMKSIAEKTSIIEEIAYQTNLLALNAAIEAARAGDHGRGFAVVATEVRRLAERSQVAAQEISELASASVKVAEHSGTLLTKLVPSIGRTADLVQQVAAASREQASGVDQINRAMSQVDRVTQQNAAAAERLSETAKEMSDQAAAVEHLLAFFHLRNEPRVVVQPTAPVQKPVAAAMPAPPRIEKASRRETRMVSDTNLWNRPVLTAPDDNDREFERF